MGLQPSLWELVAGCAKNWGNRRLTTSEFCVVSSPSSPTEPKDLWLEQVEPVCYVIGDFFPTFPGGDQVRAACKRVEIRTRCGVLVVVVVGSRHVSGDQVVFFARD